MSRLILACVFVVLVGHDPANPMAFAGDPKVSFDVPALVEAREVDTAALNSSLGSTSQKIVQVVIPVSTSINNMTHRDDISEFRFDVGWNQAVYPLLDYGPRTQTTVGIEGTIGVQEQKDSNVTFGFGVAGKPGQLASVNLNADAGQRTSRQLSFNEIPQHHLLVASGTINRGTGAFFRFHRSKTDPLEGGKELVLSFRVPSAWKSGLLLVRCEAMGSKRVVGPWKEPIKSEMSFVVPVYLEGDVGSQQLAVGFVGAEQQLRRAWIAADQKETKITAAASLASLFQRTSEVPERWLEQLILTGDSGWLNYYRSQLPRQVVSAAENFLQSRSQLR